MNTRWKVRSDISAPYAPRAGASTWIGVPMLSPMVRLGTSIRIAKPITVRISEP